MIDKHLGFICLLRLDAVASIDRVAIKNFPLVAIACYDLTFSSFK